MVGCSSCVAACRKTGSRNDESSKPLGDDVCLRFLTLTLPASCTPQVPGNIGQQQQRGQFLCPYPVGRQVQASRKQAGMQGGPCSIGPEPRTAQPFAGSQGVL